MKNFTRDDLLFSLCGLNCGLCPMKLNKYCPGCGGGEGNQTCAIARCSLAHQGVSYCFQCPEYPCVRYEGIDEFDSFITHKNRRKDFQRFQNIGPDSYQAEQKEKMEMLERLLTEYNDGRRKGFFCAAVNLLEIQDLRAVMSEITDGQENASQPVKEKALKAVNAFQSMAVQKNVEIKLRKKPR
ncbi:DUF3795 domain-containing protein [Clostridium sp. MCC353]|uniref:DUF3795 domain-containing protein n=1 Tax=Clostridium sp. MCC353 TaxID=2592646 RepID=UPI001C029314|nr:DUF3795 domain-containing protein [Clostridium sp. MCC353]MBT9779769.1 DUF3795 domain-containing protein [Clostridium sp. MCC353]